MRARHGARFALIKIAGVELNVAVAMLTPADYEMGLVRRRVHTQVSSEFENLNQGLSSNQRRGSAAANFFACSLAPAT